MVVIEYKIEGEEEPLYVINPIFRKSQNKEDEIYYNSEDEMEAQLDFQKDAILRNIKGVDKESKEYKKEKRFLRIQKDLEKKKKDLENKKREMRKILKDEIKDYKEQQIDALERIQKYVYAITNDYDSSISSKITELKDKKSK